MSSKAICIRETLYSAIHSVSAVSWLFARSPGRDFTRNVKLPFAKLITLILSLKGSSITCELMEHFGCTKTLVSEPAFVKRRGRLLPEALEMIFRLFVENTRASNRYKGFQLLAVDGSDLHTPTNPDDTASFIPGSGGQKPYNLQHLNALYDLCSHIYMDAVVQGRHQYDERRALCDMVDRANAAYPAIIIADRDYESYNVFAHIQEKGWKFLIRVKDRSSNGVVNGLELPAQDEFDVPIRLALSRKQTNKFKGLLESQKPFIEICSIVGYQINKAAMQHIVRKCPPPTADCQAVFTAYREARDAAEKRLMAPPRKISFDRKRFAPYLDKFSSDREIEKLFLEFLRERAG